MTKRTNKKIELAKTIKEHDVEGVRVFTSNTGVSDIVTLTGSFLGGKSYSPETNPLIAHITTAMIDEGTTTKTKHQIQEKLESLGANVEFSCSGLRVHFAATFLKENTKEVISILADELKHPAFDVERFNSLKTQMMGAFNQSLDNSNVQARINFLQSIYESSSPNYPNSTKDKISYIKKMKVADVKKYYKKVFGANNLIITAVGDVDVKTLLNSIKSGLGNWETRKIVPTVVDLNSNKTKDSKTKFITLKDKATVDIFTGGTLGITIDHPDYYPLLLGISILGSGMTDRLMAEIREKQGLTYGIYATLSGFADINHGHWSIWSTFAPNVLDKGRKGIEVELKKLTEKGVTQREFTKVKERMFGKYVIALETTGGFALAIQQVVESGKEISFIDEYIEIINKVQKKDINRALKEYVSSKKRAFVGAGSVNEKGKAL